jgi:hypothetical protein
VEAFAAPARARATGTFRRCSARCARRACAGRSTSSWCGLVPAAPGTPVRRRPGARGRHRTAGALAGGYGSRENFLTELTLDPPEATSDRAGPPLLDEDYLILSTIHSAKGQEWKSVHVLNVVDGCIPSDMATGSAEDIEEERRLLYVAMTRAKEHLHLVVPNRFFIKQQAQMGDRHVYAQRTRFIAPAMLKHFEECVWVTPTRRTAANPCRRACGCWCASGREMPGNEIRREMAKGAVAVTCIELSPVSLIL